MNESPMPRFGLREDLVVMARDAEPHDLLQFVQSHAPRAAVVPQRPEPGIHLLGVLVEDELYALDVSRVREVVRASAVTRVPSAPEHVRGLQSLRGALLPVLETRTRLGLAPAEIGRDTRVVIVESHGRLLGLLVDAVALVAAVPRSAIAAPPAEVRSRCSEHVAGVVALSGRTALMLDLDKLLELPTAEAPRCA